ncbi:uncharacterized protein LOC135122029 [Zophobas morio]|uniref:uncharacterized protein LOC135122029 n=1 Tax=Zophobas morio TaxID=2755281 RepID=UPI003082BAC8
MNQDGARAFEVATLFRDKAFSFLSPTNINSARAVVCLFLYGNRKMLFSLKALEDFQLRALLKAKDLQDSVVLLEFEARNQSDYKPQEPCAVSLKVLVFLLRRGINIIRETAGTTEKQLHKLRQAIMTYTSYSSRLIRVLSNLHFSLYFLGFLSFILVVFSVLLISYSLSILLTWRNCLRRFSIPFLLFFMFLYFVFFFIFFSESLILSDICMDPAAVIIELIKAKTGESSYNIKKALFCFEDVQYGFAGFENLAMKTLGAVSYLVSIICPGEGQRFKSCYGSFFQKLFEVGSILLINGSCANLRDIYIELVSLVCNESMNSLMHLLGGLSMSLLVLFFWICIILILNGKSTTSKA